MTTLKTALASVTALIVLFFSTLFAFHPNEVRSHCDNGHRVFANHVGRFEVRKDALCPVGSGPTTPPPTVEPTVTTQPPQTPLPTSEPPLDSPPPAG